MFNEYMMWPNFEPMTYSETDPYHVDIEEPEPTPIPEPYVLQIQTPSTVSLVSVASVAGAIGTVSRHMSTKT